MKGPASTQVSPPKAPWLFWLCVLTTVASIATHIYLTQHHYQFKYGQGEAASLCNINAWINCDRTTASPYSQFLGLPLSVLGGVAHLFFLILLLLWRFPLLKDQTRSQLIGPLRVISLGFVLVSLLMAFLSYGVLKTFCPACSLAYGLSIVGLLSLWRMTPKAPLFHGFHLKIYGLMLALTLSFALFIHHDSLRAYGGKERLEIIKLQFSEWKRAPEKNLIPFSPITMNPNPSAPMQMVEFGDFLCGACARAFPTLHNFAKTHPDVQFSFQAWPLDGQCNKAVSHGEGTRCLLARLSHCGEEQGLGWETQEWIFSHQRDLLSKDQVLKAVEKKAPELGLDTSKLLSCLDSENTHETIKKQVQLGIDMEIKGTPALYINGKKVPGGFSIPLLEMIYDDL